jgi:hypothetical protein
MTTATIRWFSDSPDAGDPSCLCSWCGCVIAEKDAPAIRLFDTDTNREARFHRACAGPAIGIHSPPSDDFDDDGMAHAETKGVV